MPRIAGNRHYMQVIYLRDESTVGHPLSVRVSWRSRYNSLSKRLLQKLSFSEVNHRNVCVIQISDYLEIAGGTYTNRSAVWSSVLIFSSAELATKVAT